MPYHDGISIPSHVTNSELCSIITVNTTNIQPIAIITAFTIILI